MAKKETAAQDSTEVVKPKISFRVAKHVTLPLIKLEEETPVYVKITAPMFLGKEVKGTGDKAKMEPATLAHVVNLETGEPAQIIVNAVVVANLNECYPGDTYVNKSFQLIKHAKRDGKRYHDFSILEIELE